MFGVIFLLVQPEPAFDTGNIGSCPGRYYKLNAQGVIHAQATSELPLVPITSKEIGEGVQQRCHSKYTANKLCHSDKYSCQSLTKTMHFANGQINKYLNMYNKFNVFICAFIYCRIFTLCELEKIHNKFQLLHIILLCKTSH